jgi:cytochrome c553
MSARHWLSLLALALGTHLVGHSDTLDNALQVCATCHGPGGVSVQPKTPHLNGQLPAFFVEAMQAFAKGNRPTAVAEHKTFAADQYASAAKFYAEQRNMVRSKSNTDPAMVLKGEKIYLNRCQDCHLDDGRDSDKDAPLIAAQELEFLVAQTLAFKTGARKFPFLMDDAYRGLSDDELASAAHYFAAQPQIAPAPTGKRKRGK